MTEKGLNTNSPITSEGSLNSSDSSLKDRNRSLIVHPEAIHVLFELSKYADNEGNLD
jgi:hypothetical protein